MTVVRNRFNSIQKKRLIQMAFAIVFFLLSHTLLSLYEVPDPPPLEAFLTPGQVVQYSLLQLIFLISFCLANAFLGAFVQAKNWRDE